MLLRTVRTAAKLFFSFTLVITASVFFGCSRKAGAAPFPEQEADLVIYSPHASDKTESIIREFRQRTGLRAKIVHQGTSELIGRLAAEENNGSTAADVFWGGGTETLEAAKQLFAQYKSNELVNIDKEYVDKDNYWTGFSVMTMVIAYNKQLVPPKEVPTSWADLDDPFFQGRIIIPDPLKSGSAYSILNAVLNTTYPEENWNLLKRIMLRAGTNGLAASSTTIHPSVAAGEYFVGLTSEDASLYVISTGQPLAIVYPSDGTIAVPDGVALVKNAKHKDAACLFIDFVLGHDVQEIVSCRWFRRSVRNDIALPERAEPLASIHILPYDVYDVAQKRDRILSMWEDLYKK